MESIRDVIRRFVTTNFYLAEPDALGDEDSLLDSGIIDSTGVLEVVAFLEQELGVHMDDTDILPQNLDSIACIEAFVTRSRASGRASSESEEAAVSQAPAQA
jgi:acyl carrier protein